MTDQQPVPDETKLTDEDFERMWRKFYANFSAMDRTAFHTFADAATEKAYHVGFDHGWDCAYPSATVARLETEVAELRQKAVDLGDCLDAYIENDKEEDTLFANLHERLAELQRQLDAERLELGAMRESWAGLLEERDSAREQVRALVEAATKAIGYIDNRQPYYVIKPLRAAIASAKEAQDGDLAGKPLPERL